MSSEGGRDVSMLRPRIHITHDVLRTLHATFPHSTHNFMQNKMIWKDKIQWKSFTNVIYGENPVRKFLSLFLDVFLFLFGLYLFIYTQYENLGTGKNIWQTTLGELPDAARCDPTFSKNHRLVSPLIPLPIPVFADGRCVYTSLSHGF